MLRLHHLPIALGCFAAAAALAGARLPAAADTGTLALAEPNPYTTGCPVTLHFSGQITGAPNSAVKYHFARYEAGQWTYTSDVAATISSGGSLPIQSTLGIDSAHANGLQSYEVQITVPATGNDTTKGKIYFTVNCSLAGLIHHLIASLGPSPPKSIVATNELDVCKQHASADACGWILADAVPNKSLVLAWDETDSADGYKVYRVDGGRHDNVTKQPFGNVRVSEIPKPADGYDNKCYAVSAYDKTGESAVSIPYCVGFRSPVGIPHTTLAPQSMAYRYRFHQRGLYYGPTGCDDALCVGYFLDSSNGTDLGDQTGTAFRSYLLFDPNAMRGLSNINRATLRLRITSGSGQCIDRVSAANRDWWDNKDWIDGDFDNGVGPTSASTTGALIDVTKIVRRWASGDADNGFVITGHNEDIGANTTASCTVSLSASAVLDIERY
jgi:hypothetical protein